MITNIEPMDGVNLEQGLRNTGDSIKVYTRLLANFFISCPDYHQQLQVAIQEKKPEQIRRVIHKLYGVSELLGVELIAQDCSFLLSNSQAQAENQLLMESKLSSLLLHLDRIYMQNQDKIQIWNKR
ncbi:Hpt domain-containing protein [Thiothrix eikelboomii]|uniref:Hpt domain-containing protein n=1 Tax=Thiothrix eikelboomii TaxID=92487 RepID=UPI003BB02B9C